MFEEDIPWKDQIKYLEVVIDKRLTFIPDVDYAVGKGKMVIGQP
jgi:hypothetical protein